MRALRERLKTQEKELEELTKALRKDPFAKTKFGEPAIAQARLLRTDIKNLKAILDTKGSSSKEHQRPSKKYQ